MTELKTLKDLKIELSHNAKTKKSNKDFEIVKVIVLRQEAIKWVKESMKCGDLNINRDLFIRFFNITEEDLK